MGVKAFVVACAWIAVSLTVTERALGAPQSGGSEKRRTEKQDTKKQDTEKPTADEGKAKARGDGKTITAQDFSTLDNQPLGTPHLRLKDLGRDFVQDQKQIWTSPRHLRFSDTEWLVPLAGISTGLFMTDSDVSRHLSHVPNTLSHYNTLSNAGIGALVGGAAGMWLLSYPSHNEHWRETGLAGRRSCAQQPGPG